MTPQEKAKQQAEVMLAYANGAEIECSAHGVWVPCPLEPFWNWLKVDYRVKKPAPKVVKLEAWMTSCKELRMFVAGSTNPPHWKRIPSLDLEYTEDES